MKTLTSVAMTAATAREFEERLVRTDGQEDICIATYRVSTGKRRRTALIRSVLPPEPGDRAVHGTATVFDRYILRAIQVAVANHEGVVLAHSHPGASTWQTMSGADRDAEASYANLVRETTGLPLVGMTLAGRTRVWSARHWDTGVGTEVSTSDCESIRIIGERYEIAWNDQLRPQTSPTLSQSRTISCWGERVHNDITRLRILVVGLGSVGLDVAIRLAATGFRDIGIMDFDGVEQRNLDRMIGATQGDVRLCRAKVEIAERLMIDAATADPFTITASELSICESAGVSAALDYDLIISCVDRPWPRAVLNSLAYTDLIPVIDGGIVIDTFEDGMIRSCTWRSHIVRPGRPCMSCNRQLDLGDVALDIDGLLDDTSYIGAAKRSDGQNVAALAISVSAAILSQMVSYLAAPGGMGDPGPLQYVLSTHSLEHLAIESRPQCPVESSVCAGDQRVDLSGRHERASSARKTRSELSTRIKCLRSIESALIRIQRWVVDHA